MTSFFGRVDPPSTRRAQPKVLQPSKHPSKHLSDSKVSSPSFTDYDLDVGELGGTIGWESPEVTVTITGYRVYLAEVGAWGLGVLAKGGKLCNWGGRISYKESSRPF